MFALFQIGDRVRVTIENDPTFGELIGTVVSIFADYLLIQPDDAFGAKPSPIPVPNEPDVLIEPAH